MRWPTVIFGALPASILAFPAALALLLSLGLFQPEKLITWVFLLCGIGGWSGMISLWIAAKKRPFGKRIGPVLGIAAPVAFILLSFFESDMSDRFSIWALLLAVSSIIVGATHLHMFSREGGWQLPLFRPKGAPPPLPVPPIPSCPPSSRACSSPRSSRHCWSARW